MITLRQLDIFVTAARTGSLRRCADSMGISAVAVSEHVRALEAEIGAPLFERKPGLLPTLTPIGQDVYARAIAIVADVADLSTLVSGPKGGQRKLRMAVHTYLMRNLSEELAAFRAAHPLIELDADLSVRTLDDFIDRVSRRDLDVAYCLALLDEDVPGSVLVRHEPLGIYVGRDHPFAKQEMITLEELAAEPSIQLSATEPLGILIDRLFAGLGVAERTVGLATDEFGLIVASLIRNRGYACLFAEGGAGSGEAMGFVRVRTDFPLPSLQVRRITRRSFRHDAALLELCDRVERRWELG